MDTPTSQLDDIIGIDQTSDPRLGSATTTSNSLSTLITTIVPSLCLAIALASFVVFVGRKWLPEVYGPKFALQPNRHKHRRGGTPAAWRDLFCGACDVDLLRRRELDGYLLLRYLRFCISLCLGGCFLLCSVLLPLNATGDGGMSNLDVLTMANIKMNSARLYVHSCCTAVFFAWVMYMVARERAFFIKLKHAYHTFQMRSGESGSKTLLFTDIPEEMLNVESIGLAVGGGKNVEVWLVSDTKGLRKGVKRRASLMDQIDTAMQRSSCKSLDQVCEKSKYQKTSIASRIFGRALSAVLRLSSRRPGTGALSRYSLDVARLHIEAKQRMHACLCKGEPVSWYANDRLTERELPALLTCAFVRFGSVHDASVAYHSRHHDKLSKMSPRRVGSRAEDTIWDNLRLSWWQRVVRQMLARVLLVAMIVFWSFPVALVTAVANVDLLLPGSAWQEHIPAVLQNAFRGLLPSVLLSLTMALPSKIIVWLLRFSGCMSLADVEAGLQRYYFHFRVIQVFLVAALGSTASSVLVQIYSDPSSATTILAKRLPGASSFYLSYFAVQGLSESAFVLLNVEGLLSRCLLGSMLDDTPRKRRRRRLRRFHVSAGAVLATCSSLLVVALSYAPLAPLMMCFAALAFLMFYLAYRHNLLLAADTVADTAGTAYDRALRHTLVGLYIGELSLIGMLTVASVADRRIGGPLVLSCVWLVFTVLYQKIIHDMFEPWRDRLLRPGERQTMLPRRNTGEGSSIWHALRRMICGVSVLLLDDSSLVRRVVEEACLATSERGQAVSDYLAPEVMQQEEAIELVRPIKGDSSEIMREGFERICEVVNGDDTQACYCSPTGELRLIDEDCPSLGKLRKSAESFSEK